MNWRALAPPALMITVAVLVWLAALGSMGVI